MWHGFIQAISLGTTRGSSLENHCEHKKLVKAFKHCSTLRKYQKVNTEEKFWKCDSVEKILTYFFNIKYFINTKWRNLSNMRLYRYFLYSKAFFPERKLIKIGNKPLNSFKKFLNLTGFTVFYSQNTNHAS